MLVGIFGIEGVVARDLADCDAVGKLARHHDQIADLDRVGELIELRGEVPEPVPPPVRHHLHQMLQDGVTIGEATQVAHFEKAGQQAALVDCCKLAVALLSGPNNPKTCHALGRRLDLIETAVGRPLLAPGRYVDLTGDGSGDQGRAEFPEAVDRGQCLDRNLIVPSLALRNCSKNCRLLITRWNRKQHRFQKRKPDGIDS